MSWRVLHVSQPTDAGVARVVADAVAFQHLRGWDVAVACPDEAELPTWISSAGSHLAWPARRAPGPQVISETIALREILDEWKPDLVHLHSAKAGLCGRLALRGRAPTVFQPHAWSFLAVGGATAVVARAWERFARRWTDVIVCVSEAERSLGDRARVGGRSIVIPNGVDVDHWTPSDEREREEARRELGARPEDYVVVCVGRLTKQKAQDVLIAAWDLVRTRIPDARLVLVGDGPERDRFQGMAGPGVTFLGSRRDVARWYAAADVVALPSRWEGMPLTLLEALACGRPVVATDVEGVREIVVGCGAITPVDDHAALAAALVERGLTPELRATEGEAGRARIEGHFDLRTTMSSLLDVYERLLRA